MMRSPSSHIRVLWADTFFIAALIMMFDFPTTGQQVQQGISLLPPMTYITGCSLNAVAVGDLDGDGHPDLVVANWFQTCNGVEGPGNVGVLLGNGDGTFKAPVSYFSGGFQALAVAVGDLNGDGKLDVVVANSCPDDPSGNCAAGLGQIGVLLGNGDGTFQPVVSYYSGGGLPNAVAITDVNGDGHLDLVVDNYCQPVVIGCSNPGSVGLLLGLGDGTFGPAVTYGTGNDVNTSLAVGDLNGDGHPDVVVISGQDIGTVNVLLGNGDGSFRLPTSYSPVGYEPQWVAIGDVNGDGQPDLVVATYCQDLQGSCNAGSVAVLLGKGDETFQAPVFYSSGAFNALSVAIGDMNNDGHPDLLVTNDRLNGAFDSPGIVAVLPGRGDGTFQRPLNFLSGGANPRAVLATDVNGDAKPDVVVANFCPQIDKCDGRSPGTIGVLLNNTPFCTTPPVVTLSATPTSLWPPNEKMMPVTVSGTITDISCTVTTAAYAVTDEYGRVQPSGPVTLGPRGTYTFTVLLQASRLGTDLDGRLYTITVSASNNTGKTGSQTTGVIVSHDQGR